MTAKLNNADILHLLTGRTPLNINRLMSNTLKRNNVALTKEQWSIMAVLWKNNGCTQQVLADTTYRDRAGITRLLDNLQREGFIERRTDPDDRRTNLVYLTKKGKSIRQPVIEALNDTIEIATKGLTDKQINNLRITFEQINHNIQELENNLKA